MDIKPKLEKQRSGIYLVKDRDTERFLGRVERTDDTRPAWYAYDADGRPIRAGFGFANGYTYLRSAAVARVVKAATREP